MQIGAVLDYASYWQTDQKFTDLMTINGRMDDPLGKWIIAREGYARPGTYMVSATGKGKVAIWAQDVPRQEFAFDGSSPAFPVEFGPHQPDKKSRTFVQITASDPADPLGRPNVYPAGLDPAADPFHPGFLESLRNIWAIRSVHFYDVEASKETTWATARKWLWTLYFKLCAGLDAIPWVDVPHMADADYCEQLGKLAASILPPHLRPILEYSNECWNWAYPFSVQTAWVNDQGKARYGMTNNHASYAIFASLAWAAFERGLGRDSTRVLCNQFTNPSLIQMSTNKCVKDGVRFDAIACAPYAEPRGLAWAAADGLWGAAARVEAGIPAATSAEQVARDAAVVADLRATAAAKVTDRMLSQIPTFYEPLMAQWADIAGKAGVQLHAYEWGQGLRLNKPTEARAALAMAAHRSEGMGAVTAALAEAMHRHFAGGCHSGFIGTPTASEFFALKASLDDDTPKWRAFRALVDRWNA